MQNSALVQGLIGPKNSSAQGSGSKSSLHFPATTFLASSLLSKDIFMISDSLKTAYSFPDFRLPPSDDQLFRKRERIGLTNCSISLMSSVTISALPSMFWTNGNAETYALIPPTRGADMPAFAVRVLRAETDHPPEEPAAKPAFGRAEMLSTENTRILKEIMQ